MFKLSLLMNVQRLQLEPSPMYQVIGLDGLDMPEVDIHTMRLFGSDGERVTSRRTPGRTITITMVLKTGFLPGFNNIEYARQYLYKYLNLGQYVTVEYNNDTIGTVFISGVVKRIECNQWSNPQTAQIEIYCPCPTLQQPQKTFDESYKSNSGWFTVENTGNLPAGFIFDIYPLKTLGYIEIDLKSTGQHMRFEKEFVKGDVLAIGTSPDNPWCTLTHSWAPFDDIPAQGGMTEDSEWLTLSTKKIGKAVYDPGEIYPHNEWVCEDEFRIIDSSEVEGGCICDVQILGRMNAI